MNFLLLNFVIALGFTSISTLLIGIFVYIKNPKNIVNKTFASYSFSIAWWSFCQIWLIAHDERLIALIWARIEQVGVFFIPTFFLHFIISFLNIKDKGWLIRIAYLFSFVFASLCPTRLMMADAVPKFYVKYFATPGFAYHFAVTFFFTCIIYGLYQLFKEYKISTGTKRNQLRYLLWPSLLGYIGGGANFFLVYDINIYPLNPFGTYFVGLYALSVAYAVVKYRLMDINIVITRGIAYGGIVAVIAGAYIGLMFGLDKAFSKFPGYNPILTSSLLFILFLFMLIFILPRMKIRAVDMVKDSIFAGKYDYQRQLEEVSTTISTKLNLKDLSEYALGKIKETMGIEKLSLLVFDEVIHQYTVCGSLGLDKKNPGEVKIGENFGLAGLLKETPQALIKEELEKIVAVPRDTKDTALEQFKSLQAEACIPLMVKGDLTGILALGNKKSGEMYSDEDLSLLSTLANQLGLTIEYIKAIERIASEKRFVSLGKASLRMAHDIRNPLVSIKTCLQLLPIKYPELFAKMREKDADYTDGLYQTAGKDVDRITNLIERALDYARHPEPVFSRIDLYSTIDEALATMQPTFRETNIEVSKIYQPRLDKITADSEQLTEVFTNLFSNAANAMENQRIKKLTITTEDKANLIYVTVADTGCGISEKNISDIFDPFITYTHKGSGLGLAIVKKIIEEHCGTITVSSELGKGTAFTINLPKSQPSFRKEKTI